MNNLISEPRPSSPRLLPQEVPSQEGPLEHFADESGSAHPDPTRFVFGAVAFDIHPSPGLIWQIGEEHRLFRSSYTTGPTIAHVHCAADSAPHLDERIGREIRSDSDGQSARIETNRVRAQLRKLSPGRYAATAYLTPDENGCASLCTALAAVVGQLEGGLILHAAAIELDDKAYLFIGPSGAGKTTAAHHCDTAKWLARDRAIVFPTPSGWQVAGLAGGDVIEIPQSDRRVLPLGGVFRIRRNAPSPEIEKLSLVGALGALRESIQTTDGVAEEERALDTAIALSEGGWVSNLHTVLGGQLSTLLRSFR